MQLLCAGKEEKKYSYEEFKKIFYPKASKKKLEDIDDPKKFGRELSKRSIKKVEKYFDK